MQLPGPEQHFLCCYIFLIATYRRTSGSDLTATSPSAAPAAATVIAITYPSVRIVFLLLVSGSATADRDIDVHHLGAGSAPRWQPPWSPGSLTACSGPSYLAAGPGNGGR